EGHCGAPPAYVGSSIDPGRCSIWPEVANHLHQEVTMRRIVASLSAVLMLAAVTAAAQEKMKDPAKSGHEGMATGGAQSDATVIAKATSAAPPDIGRNAAVMGKGTDGKMKALR